MKSDLGSYACVASPERTVRIELSYGRSLGFSGNVFTCVVETNPRAANDEEFAYTYPERHCPSDPLLHLFSKDPVDVQIPFA
jgi:hypothetical protein